MPMLEVSGLSYAVPDRSLLTDVHFGLARGQCLGIVGPNGAGKSTLLRLLSGFLKASAGEVRLAGQSVHALPAQARARLLAVVHPREELPPFAMQTLDYL